MAWLVAYISDVRAFLRENSLSVFCLAIFLASIAGQSLAGWRAFNEEASEHEAELYSYGRYLVSSEFGAAVIENWQSEWLQFFLFVLATVWLVQKGSPESKEIDKVGRESDEEQKVGEHADPDSPRFARARGWRLHLYSNSLVYAFALLFSASWLVQSLTGWSEYNEVQREHGEGQVSWGGYLARPDFWERTLQNWQSEFLAVGAMAVFSIYLRQRGSPESKPVGEAHGHTGVTG